MRVAILVPRRADHGRRDEIWEWVENWLQTHHPDWPIFEGADDGKCFSMAKARNDAARKAGDWDVAVIIDADTIAEPEALHRAVEMAANSRKIVIAGDVRMRVDKPSSDRIMAGGLWFTRPEGERHPKDGVVSEMVYGEPSSGVIAISRELWDATGGYVENMKGWGWEDLVFITQCFVVGDGISWVRDSILLHLYHDRTPITHDTMRNKTMYSEFHNISCRSHEKAKEYLRNRGHKW